MLQEGGISRGRFKERVGEHGQRLRAVLQRERLLAFSQPGGKSGSVSRRGPRALLLSFGSGHARPRKGDHRRRPGVCHLPLRSDPRHPCSSRMDRRCGGGHGGVYLCEVLCQGGTSPKGSGRGDVSSCLCRRAQARLVFDSFLIFLEVG